MCAVSRVSTVAGTGIPTHVPLAIWLSLPEYAQYVPSARRPKAFPTGWQDASKDREREISFEVAWNILLASAINWQARSDVDSLWTSICDDMETYFLTRAEEQVTSPERLYRLSWQRGSALLEETLTGRTPEG